MAKTPVFWGLDCEDAHNPESDDALLRLCEIHADNGIPLNLFFSGQKARFLRRNARHDLAAALKDHNICYHGNYWFDYPEPALLYGADDDWDRALSKALSIEVPGINEVAEVTGQYPSAYVQHQSNHSAVTQYAARLGGIRVNNGGFGDQMPHNAWVMDTLFAGRASRTVSPQGNWSNLYDPLHPERVKPPVDPDQELRAFQESFDRQLEQGHDHVNITGHPTCWVCAEWWGWYEFSIPFRIAEGAHRPVGLYPHDRQWRKTAMRSQADSDAHFEWTRRAAEWLASRDDIECLSLKEYYDRCAEPAGQWLTLAEVRQMCRDIIASFDAVKAGPTMLSAADALFVLATLGEYVMLNERLPEKLQVRRTLGPVEPVPEMTKPVTYKRDNYLLAARTVYAYTMAHNRLPHVIRAHSVDAGPAQVLIALAQAFAADELPEQVTVAPMPGLPKCSEYPIFRNAKAASTNAPAFYDSSRISEQCRLQSWSYRPLAGG